MAGVGGDGALVARTGRKHQRYEDGVRLVAGCIPYRVREHGQRGQGQGNKEAKDAATSASSACSTSVTAPAVTRGNDARTADAAAAAGGGGGGGGCGGGGGGGGGGGVGVAVDAGFVTNGEVDGAAAVAPATPLEVSGASAGEGEAAERKAVAAAAAARVAATSTATATTTAAAAGGNEPVEDCIEILMITSQHGHGLLFPKGGWETDETAEEAACREAVEEAGVRGELEASVGTFEFRSKRVANTNAQCRDGACRAHIFVMAVRQQLEVWPERDTRQRFWLSLREAIVQVRHEWMRNALKLWLERLRLQPPKQLLLLRRQKQGADDRDPLPARPEVSALAAGEQKQMRHDAEVKAGHMELQQGLH